MYSDLQTLLDNKQSQYGLEGASISVLLKDGSSWTGVSGNRLPNTQLDPNLQWNIGSVRKTYISTVILQMVDEGKLDLNDMIGMYLNTSTMTNVDSSISIKSLLNHTSPLVNGWVSPSTFWTNVWNNRDSIWSAENTIQFTPSPVANPNAEHRYQGHINYALLTLLIEEVEGKGIDQVIDERISIPLGLQNTTVCAGAYDMAKLNGVYEGTNSRGTLSHNSYFTSRAAINATLQDLNVYMQALHNGNFLDANSLNLMYNNAVTTPNSGPIPCGGYVEVDYGLGTLIPTLYFNNGDTLKLYGHSGTGVNVGSVFSSPKDDWTVSVFCNEFDNQLTNALVFDVLCHMHQNPVDLTAST